MNHLQLSKGLAFRQRRIQRIDAMPYLPRPLRIIDWKRIARTYDEVVFDYDAEGKYFPLVWTDPTQPNFAQDGFGLYSYVGDPRLGPISGNLDSHEGITAIGSVLGSSLVGIDKSRQQGRNFVRMCQNYFNRTNGMYIVANRTRMDRNTSFWYDIYPNMLFFALADLYPNVTNMADIMWVCSERYNHAAKILRQDYWHTAFDFARMEPVDNGVWVEPHAAAGIAWLQYAAYNRFGHRRFLHATDSALRFLHNETRNPTYEALMPWGALTAARMNAELKRDYDLHKMLNWCFGDGSDARKGWGVIVGRWNGYDVSGLAGSTIDFGGYAFAMNTFNLAMGLTPLVRYAPQYARAIGKWLLNAVNAARLFYPSELPDDNQTCAEWLEPTKGAIAYEGLAHNRNGSSPLAMGDPLMHGWAETDLCLYGSCICGGFAALVEKTNVPGILEMDCRKTDFFADPSYPTHLYFNPHSRTRTVATDVGPNLVDLYDLVTRQFVAVGVSNEAAFNLPPNESAVIVRCPANGKWTRDGDRLLVDGITVDFGVR